MGEVPGSIHEGVMVWEYGPGAEDAEVTTLLTVGATKFGTFVVWMARSSSSTRGAMIMGTVGVEMFAGPTCEALSWNVWTQVAAS